MRDKLIELIIDGFHNCTKPHEVYAQLDLEALADYLIAHGVTVQEWIPVSERLPKDGIRVLVLHDDGVVRIGMSRGYFPSIVSKTHTKAYGITEVTHWMPLPESPKEVE